MTDAKRWLRVTCWKSANFFHRYSSAVGAGLLAPRQEAMASTRLQFSGSDKVLKVVSEPEDLRWRSATTGPNSSYGLTEDRKRLCLDGASACVAGSHFVSGSSKEVLA